MKYTTALAVTVLALGVQAHMIMNYPPEFHSEQNPHSKIKDNNLNKPLQVEPLDVSKFICKGYNVEMKDATGEGAPTAIWKQGATTKMTLGGSASHGGGSCQMALSYDMGKTFTVIHSSIGGLCSASGDHPFTIPSDAPISKSVIFAWTWYNVLGGTREVYMNCASVSIESGSGSSPAVPFNKRPDMAFFSMYNPAGYCQTDVSTEAIFPDPGPEADVSRNLTKPDKSGSITRECIEANRKFLKLGRTADMVFPGNNNFGSASKEYTNPPSGPTAPVTQAVKLDGATPMPSSPTTLATLTTNAFVISNVAATVCAAPSVVKVPGPYDQSSSAPPSPVSEAPAGTTSNAPGYHSIESSPVPLTSVPTQDTTASAPAKAVSGCITTDGFCGSEGNGTTCLGSTTWGACCSGFSYCGVLAAHCGKGCQEGFGTCGEAGKTANKLQKRRYLGRAKRWLS